MPWQLMESTGLTVVIAAVLLLIVALVIGRLVRKKQPAAEAKPGNKRAAPVQFTDRGH
jgi:hypothetical protein